jgi:hypothetical protein
VSYVAGGPPWKTTGRFRAGCDILLRKELVVTEEQDISCDISQRCLDMCSVMDFENGTHIFPNGQPEQDGLDCELELHN